MRLPIIAVGLLVASSAYAQEDPGGPKIFRELDALTSTSAATSTIAPPPPPLHTPIGKGRGILGINVVDLGGHVRIKSLKPDGPAERAGIVKWDTLVSIDGVRVANRRGYVAVMAEKHAGQPVIVEWMTGDGATHTARVALDAGRRAISDSPTRARIKRRLRRVPRRPRTRKWYGWQGLASDAASLVLVAFTSKSSILGGLGLVGYGIGTPLTHFFHENVGMGLLSMGLRVAVPALTVLGTIGICDEARVCSDATPLAVVGGLIMFVVVPAVDAAALSWQKLEPERTTSVGVSLAPTVAPTDRGGATFGLAGTF